jgi:small subunit ribosomal protein S4
MINKPKFKIGRRLGAGVYDKCQTSKFSTSSGGFSSRPKRRRNVSEYGLQLIEKQKIRFSYGISEKQLSNYVKKASATKLGTAERFYEMLESRLDNVVYRMGLAPSRRAARQMVSHGHFVIAGHRVKVPSFSVKEGDIIQVREGSKGKKIFADLEIKLKDYTAPDWLSFDQGKMEGKILGKPKNTDSFLDLNAVLEFYSR